MSEDRNEREDREAGAEEAPPGGEKEKLSRAALRKQKESKKKRRAAVALMLALGLAVAVLAVGAALDIPYINAARRAGSWVADRFSASPGGEEEARDYLFLTHPQSGKKLEGEVSVLLAVFKEGGEGGAGRDIIYLALFTCDPASGKGEFYLVPETSAAYNVAGQQTSLARALREEGGEDLLRSTVGNMAGVEVDYLALVEFWDAARMLQGLGLPPLALGEDTVFVNPTNGESDFLPAGQELRDGDRLLMWLLASDKRDAWEAYTARKERARDYLPGALDGMEPQVDGGLEAAFASSLRAGRLVPGTGSAEGDGPYLASMLQALADFGQGDLAFKAVPASEVVNGCGVPDLGKKVGERISSLGLPLAGTGGNAKVVVDGEEVNDFTHEESSIVCRSEDERLRAYARYLGVLMSIRDVRFEPGPGAEVVIIAGRDLAS